MFEISLIVSLAASAFMAGLTTFVQRIHYPGFHFTDKQQGRSFHDFHTRNTGLVVGAPMLIELAGCILMISHAPDTTMLWLSLSSGVLLAGIWMDTALRVIPLHNKLKEVELRDPGLIDKLVRTNFYRTIFWNTRVLLLIIMVIFLLY